MNPNDSLNYEYIQTEKKDRIYTADKIRLMTVKGKHYFKYFLILV